MHDIQENILKIRNVSSANRQDNTNHININVLWEIFTESDAHQEEFAFWQRFPRIYE